MSPNPAKDTVYVDVDDEITSIIDKVHTSTAGIVALVLPKRATMLQSSVNMKLLKKAADSDKKRVVLITTEAALIPLAAATGMYVAKGLQSKPEIPSTEATDKNGEIEELAAEEETPAEELDTKAAADTPVGELAGEAVAVAEEPAVAKAKPELTPRPIPRAKPDDADEAIELDNSDDSDATQSTDTAGDKKSKGKKLKVPNFEKFRLRVILAVALLIILIVGFILANSILPKATVIISTKTSGESSSLILNLTPGAKSLNASQMTVPATVQQTQKANSQQVNTTGQQNNGTKATGSATLVNCGNNPATVPAGTGISGGGLTYITQQAVSLEGGTFNGFGSCITTGVKASSGTVNISAQTGGTAYNTSFSGDDVAGYSGVSASGSASGGTDNIVQVVSQTDINNATAKLTAPSAGSIKSTLQTALQKAGLYAIPATFNASAPATTQSANVGDQATTVTVTQTITYSMLGVHESDLQTLVDSSTNKQINTSKQAILNDGLSQASFTIISNSGTGGAQATMDATATIGPKLDVASIKKQVAGQRTGDVESIVNANPNVTNVSVHYSPFWVSSMPKSISKITIQIKKSS